MRAAIDIADVVGKNQHVFGVTVVVLHRHFAVQHRLGIFPGKIDNILMKRFFALVEMFDECPNPIGEFEHLFLIVSVVPEGDLQPAVEIRQFPDSFEQCIVCKFGIAEYFLIGLKSYFCPAFSGLAYFFDSALGDTSCTLEMKVFSVAIHIGLKPFAQGIHHADADAVQPAGHFVTAVVKLAAGVQLREHDFQSTYLRVLVCLDRDTPAVVLDGATAVRVDTHADVITRSRHGLVNGIVQNLIDQMMESCAAAVADIHIRPFAHRLQAPEDLYVTCVIFLVLHINSVPLSYISSLFTDKLLKFLRFPLLRLLQKVTLQATTSLIFVSRAFGHCRCSSSRSSELHNCNSYL